MAFINDPNQDDEDLINGQSAKAGQPITTGENAFVGGGTTQTGPTNNATSPAGTSSGSYTNLQNYLTGNTAGEQTMASNLTNDVNSKGTAAKSSLGDYQNSVLGDVASGTKNQDSNVISDINGGVKPDVNAWSDQQLINSSAPTAWKAPDTSSVVYGGPSDINHLNDDSLNKQNTAYANVSKAKDTVGQVTGGFDNLSAYLKGQNTQPAYTSGENNLDTFLTGSSDAGKSALSDAGKNWGDIGNQASAVDSSLNNAIEQGKATTNATKSAYDNAIAARQQADTDYTQKFNNAQAAAKGRIAAEAARAAKQAAAEKVSPFIQPNSGGYSTGYGPDQGTIEAHSKASPFANTGAYGQQDVIDAQNAADMAMYDANSTPLGAHGGKVERPAYSNLMSKLRSK